MTSTIFIWAFKHSDSTPLQFKHSVKLLNTDWRCVHSVINFAYKHPKWTHNLVVPIKGEGPKCDNYREIPLTALSRTRNCHNCRTRNCQLPRSVTHNGTKWRGSTRRRATVGHKSARNLPRTADWLCTVQYCIALYSTVH